MSIIGKYKFLNVLKDKTKMYRRSKKRKYKEASYDLKNYYNNMRKIRKYEKEKEIKSSEKFEMCSDYMSTQESVSTNEEQL